MSVASDFKELLPKVADHQQDVDERPGYLWVFDPQDGEVYLEDERGDHPAHFPTHKRMAQHVTHPERLEGYAEPILGMNGPHAWRITDVDNHKIDDPYVLERVRKALRHEHPAPPLPQIRYHGDPR